MKTHKKPLNFLLNTFLVALTGVLIFGCTNKEPEKLIILHAGSLSIPLKTMSAEFNKSNPKLQIILEPGGSRTCARKISDLNRKVDIMFSADSSVITNLLIPEHAEWNINFATNEMSIMYTEKSKYSNEITADNWPEILLRKGVTYGHSDPNADPCGYRSQLVWQLAEKYYKIPNLYQKLVDKKHFIRPKETDLLALLESYTMDYLFIYRSVAKQHHGKYLILPEQINLKSKKYVNFYKTSTLKITGKKPGTWITKKGKPMVYGLTIPKNAPNPKAAIKFLEFVLSGKGRQIMSEMGQPPIYPATSAQKNKLPKPLAKFLYVIPK
jgi:molybdate/tungstate transport system substrate-binding protein